MGALKNPDARHIDFEPFIGVVPDNPKLLPCDIDFVIERKGHFLVAEWKREGESFSTGQRLMLEALSKKSDFTVLLVNGTSTDKAFHVTDFYQLKEQKEIISGLSANDLMAFIREWYARVNGSR
jgi:hypothetical protein